MEAKPEYNQSKFVCRFVSDWAGASIPREHHFGCRFLRSFVLVAIRVQSSHAKAKFDATVEKESRMNPDTSAGLFVSGAILHRTSRTGGNCSEFRSILRDHAEANRDRFLALNVYPSLSGNPDPEGWWETNILDRICKSGTDYAIGARYEEWFDATYVAPIVADLFGTKIVLYDAAAKTTTTFAPGRKGKVTQTHVASLVPPPKDAITLIYQSNHYYWVADIKPSMP